MKKVFTLSIFLLISFALQAKQKPNIILIMVDDMGYSDLGCFGSEIETPNIDSLAQNGIRFTNFTNCAKCESTRLSLLTGLYHIETYKQGHKNAVTIPEVLKTAGYQNFMAGKWHIFDTPMERGFDRYFGFLEGAVNSMTGEGKGENSFRLNDTPYKVPEKGFYTTDAFTDYAIRFLKERDEQKPFFMYMAYNAPHYPLHASKELVMKYRGKYQEGWEKLRQKRFNRMKELKIIPQETKLSDPEPDVRSWSSLKEEEKDDMDMRMAAFAAMIDSVDQNIGRLLQTLKSEKVLDNTLIVFLSDNGACPFDRTRENTLKKKLPPWDPRSYWCYPQEWANACNTPFRKYKQNQNEGGVATAMIAHWPQGIKNPGSFDRERAHITDLHATFTDLGQASYPQKYKGITTKTTHGLSLAKSFNGEQRPLHKEIFYCYMNKYSALVEGKWKMVDQKYLYDISQDRIESQDLSKKHPDRLKAMIKRWKELHEKYNKKAKKKN